MVLNPSGHIVSSLEGFIGIFEEVIEEVARQQCHKQKL